VNNAAKLAKDKVEGETSRLKPVLEGILASRGDALGKTYEEEFEKEEKPTPSESTQPVSLQGMFGHMSDVGFQGPRAFGNPWYS